MSYVNTGDLLNFQDYSPEHNRTARIDVEAVHTNQYNSGNSNFNYEEPKIVTEDEEPAPKSGNHNFWTIEYYQKYFDVHTNEVVERIISSVLPQKVSRNYFDERIKGKPDLYGPIWISVTLIFTIAVSGNIASYLQNANKEIHWRYDFHLTPESPTMMSLFCLYGYSLSIYIPVAILWTIQVSWLQWLLVLLGAFVSGAVLIFWLLPALRKSKYFLVLIASILAFHFLLAAGFMLYFFHVPDNVTTVLTTSTTAKAIVNSA
ncbi:unnamed protein product [Leptidea sinapis]|uniref:Protein YIPF n=1 Tax=Leptidea sinapis TaxID=189913 RepID=A0A5E4QA44_9NEOP|nr:unnamed protein product [Leptidea sinapis]